MAQLAVVQLALRVGRPVVVDPAKLAWAGHLRDAGHTIAEIVTTTGIARTSLYRHLPPRLPDPVTAGVTADAPDRDEDKATMPPRGEDRP